jgi:NAD-dependent deacetylase
MSNQTNNKKVLIFSGAGISAESGIRTFRDSNGLWEEYNVNVVCSVEGYVRNPQLVNEFYDARRNDLRDRVPNVAHEMVARVKRKYGNRIEVLTQNIDDLFERAGCTGVIHLHGTLTQLQCTDCGTIMDIGYEPQKDIICTGCKRSKYIRHNVVMFGENAPMYRRLRDAINDCDLLVVIGTSGQMIGLPRYTEYFEESILNNMDTDGLFDSFFTTVYTEEATIAAPKIEADIERFLS